MEAFEKTIDWKEYWQEADESDREAADASGLHVVEPLLEFFDERGGPSSYADVGCGPASAAFAVAERHPESTVVGYDAADPILDENRMRANDQGIENVEFERTVLPTFAPDRQFEVVSSFYTLCYVPEIEQALTALYDAVAPGGYLVISYHNEFARSMFASIAERPHDHLGEDSAWDPDHFEDRFSGVIEGDTLLSYRTIHEALDAWPQSLWSEVETERYRAWRQNPLVFVPKP